MTESIGEVGTLGPVHPYSPPLTSGLDDGQVFLKGLRCDFGVRTTSKDACVVNR